MGMRLKNPSSCPKPIANIIQKCFDIQPAKRPDFKEIKDLLQSSYNTLFVEPSKKKEIKISSSSDYTVLIHQTDTSDDSSSMKARYYQVLNANKEKKESETTAVTSGPYIEVDMSNDTFDSS